MEEREGKVIGKGLAGLFRACMRFDQRWRVVWTMGDEEEGLPWFACTQP